MKTKKSKHQKRLEYLRKQILDECISYGEIVELQNLKKHIGCNDVLLLEWAGVDENKTNEVKKCK